MILIRKRCKVSLTFSDVCGTRISVDSFLGRRQWRSQGGWGRSIGFRWCYYVLSDRIEENDLSAVAVVSGEFPESGKHT